MSTEQAPARLYLSLNAAARMEQRMNASFEEAIQRYPVGYIVDVIISEAREHPEDPWSERISERLSQEAAVGGVVKVYREVSAGTLDAYMEFWEIGVPEFSFDFLVTLRVPPNSSVL